MSKDSRSVLVSVADCLLAVVLHPVASVIHLRAVVVEDLQAVLAPSLGAVCVLRLVVFDVRLFAEEGERTAVELNGGGIVPLAVVRSICGAAPVSWGE